MAILLVCQLGVPGWGQNPDFDGDGTVGFLDFFQFADNFGTGSPPADPMFDLDGDGAIGFLDFFLFADQFGKEVSRTQEQLAATLTLPPDIPLVPEQLQMTTPLGTSGFGADGAVSAPTIVIEKPQVVVVEDPAGNPVLLGKIEGFYRQFKRFLH